MIASLCRTVLDIQRIEQCSSPQHLASLCLQTCDVGKTLKTMGPCCGQTELGQIYRTGSARHRQPDKNLEGTDFSAKEPIFSLIVIERRDGSCWQSTKDCRSGVMGLLTQTTSKLSVVKSSGAGATVDGSRLKTIVSSCHNLKPPACVLEHEHVFDI